MNIDEMKDRIARAEEIQRYTENRCEALEKQIAELKAELSENKVADCHIVNGLCEQLTKAKEIIREFLNYNSNSDWSVISNKAEQFLKDSEVEK